MIKVSRVALVVAGLSAVTLAVSFGLGGRAAPQRVDAAVTTATQSSWAATLACTADISGYCTVRHPAGVVPDAVVITPKASAMTSVDRKTAATFRVRFYRAISSSGAVTALPGARTFNAVVYWTRPRPTPSPTTPSPTTPSPTTPTPHGACDLPKYPTPACTGVPVGTVFARTVDGDYDATTPGQVIDGWHITGDLNVRAPNVVITRTQIDRSVWNRFGPGADSQTNTYAYTITDSTIGPATSCIRAAGLQEANYTATRVLIRGHDHGVDMSEPGHVLVQDSYLVMCYLPPSVAPPDGSHVDGIQTYCPEGPCTDLRLSHNTFDMRPDGNGTFVINVVDPHVSVVTVNDNLLAGGDNYVIVIEWRSGPDFVVNDNRVVNGTWGGAAPASAEGTCSHQSWQGNTIVSIDGGYNVTGTVSTLPCIE